MLPFLVWLTVFLHFAFTALVAVGGFCVWRWPALFWPHMALLAWAVSVPFLQPRCPLTDLEKYLRTQADMPVYASHFIDQYVYQVLQPYPWLFECVMIGLPILSYFLLARVGRARLLGAIG